MPSCPQQVNRGLRERISQQNCLHWSVLMLCKMKLPSQQSTQGFSGVVTDRHTDNLPGPHCAFTAHVKIFQKPSPMWHIDCSESEITEDNRHQLQLSRLDPRCLCTLLGI